MTKPVAPTPTPWKMKRAEIMVDGAYDFAIYDEQRQVVAEVFGRTSPTNYPPAEANAALIVRAVNSHQALVEVVRRLVQMHDEQDWPIENDLTLLENARKALALAEDRSQ